MLESLRRRRLELKQQREQSLGRKTTESLSSTVSGTGYKLERHREYFHNEGKTDTVVDSDPNFRQMREEEQQRYQTYQSPIQASSYYTDIDHEGSHQNPKKVQLGTITSCNVTSSSSHGLEDILVADQHKSEHKVCLVTIIL